MTTIKVKTWAEVPQGYTGIVEFENGDKIWVKNRKDHREDGPSYVRNDGYKEWWLDGKLIWSSVEKLDLRNQIILSKTQHPNYPTVQVWKILDSEGIYEQIIIPGMEENITE